MSTDDPLVQAVAKLIARHHNPLTRQLGADA